MTDHIPNSFYEDEVRCGFYVSSFAKRWWAAQISVMEEFARVCGENGLNWCAGYGTLIGAVRHKGYIPWDDDIDLFMPRQDYERFRKIFKTSFPPDWKLLSCYNGYGEWNLRLNNGELIHESNLEDYNYYPFVVGLDIFPIDYIPKDERKRDEIGNKVTQLLRSVKKRDNCEEVCKAFCKIDKILTDGSIKAISARTEDYYTCIYAYTYGEEKGEEPFWPHDVFKEMTDSPFEYSRVKIPARFHEVLRITFGDYMTPKKYIASHDYPLYNYSLKCWKSVFGKDFLRYSFSKKDLVPEKRMLFSTSAQKIRAFISYIEKLHTEIKKDVAQKVSRTTIDKLISCQDLAVWLGQSIEKETEYFPLVRKLEEYAEDIYVLSEKIKTQPETADVPDYIICESKKYINEKKDIIFLVRRKEDWKGIIKEFWETIQKSGGYNTRIVVVPYYYIDPSGKVIETKNEIGDFISTLGGESAEDVDIQAIRPDIIVTQMPFDGYNYAYAIPDRFYTNKIKEYTQKLIYVPPLLTDDFDEDDACSYLTMDYYCTTSGVVNSDYTVVQSENMRKMYIDKLVHFSNEERETWEKRIITKEDLWAIMI